MARQVAITVNRPRDEVESLWSDAGSLAAAFKEAPGGRGTEIHLEIEERTLVGEVIGKVTGDDRRAEAMDELRRFKQLVETGVIARSDGTPEGEAAPRKLKQRPAQPPEESEPAKERP